MNSEAFDAIFERIHRLGPLPFDVVVEAALYGPGGFFTKGAGAGRGADFITSPEVGPLFGAVVGSFLDEAWTSLDRPDPFFMVEAGAGRGALATSVLAAKPQCLKALRYICVERSQALRDRIESDLPVEPASNVFGVGSDDDELSPVLTGKGPDGRGAFVEQGPIVTLLDDLPPGPFPGVVLANELLDNLAFLLLERVGPGPSGWAEVRVGLSGDESSLVEVLVDASSDLCTQAEHFAPDASVGARLPLQVGAQEWLHQALSTIENGRLVIIDYADQSPSLAARPCQEWLRTYRAHERGGHPLDDFGNQDITCEVAIDQLARVRPPDHDTSQADWLRLHGLDDQVVAAKKTWHERAAIGDLEAMKARSRVNEAEALTDPSGLGAFRVLEWVI